jgi:hypothetical protein
VEYDYSMGKVDWLAAGVFLMPSSVELVNDQKRWCRICRSNGNKVENVDQKQADNLIRQSGVQITGRNIKRNFSQSRGI